MNLGAPPWLDVKPEAVSQALGEMHLRIAGLELAKGPAREKLESSVRELWNSFARRFEERIAELEGTVRIKANVIDLNSTRKDVQGLMDRCDKLEGPDLLGQEMEREIGMLRRGELGPGQCVPNLLQRVMALERATYAEEAHPLREMVDTAKRCNEAFYRADKVSELDVPLEAKATVFASDRAEESAKRWFEAGRKQGRKDIEHLRGKMP